MQFVGFLIGHDGAGQPCIDQTYCIIPWAGSDKDLNAIILYLNAFTFGLGGVVTLILSAYSDYWRESFPFPHLNSSDDRPSVLS